MTSRQETFANNILRIQGVHGFILVRKDGQILASKTDMAVKPQTLAAMIILSGQDCRTLKQAMGFTEYHYLMISQKDIGQLIIFPFQRYFLGVLNRSQEHDPVFIDRIRRFIRSSVSTGTDRPDPDLSGIAPEAPALSAHRSIKHS